MLTDKEAGPFDALQDGPFDRDRLVGGGVGRGGFWSFSGARDLPELEFFVGGVIGRHFTSAFGQEAGRDDGHANQLAQAESQL